MPLTKRAALKCLARTAFVNAAMTARGMQQIGLSYVLAPALRCLYTDPVTLGQAFARYAGHSNTHVFMLPAYTGLLLSMEEQIAGGVLPASVLTSLRTTLATTLSALGDAFFSGSMRTFWALTCVFLLLEGNIWPAAIFTLILLSILQIFRVVSFFFCLTHGIAALRWIRSVDVPTWVERTKICNALLICLTLWIMLDAGLSGWSLPTTSKVALLSVHFSFCIRSAPSAQPSKPVVPEIISKLSPAGCFLVWWTIRAQTP